MSEASSNKNLKTPKCPQPERTPIDLFADGSTLSMQPSNSNDPKNTSFIEVHPGNRASDSSKKEGKAQTPTEGISASKNLDVTRVGTAEDELCGKLAEEFAELQKSPRLSWATHIKFLRCLGSGGQGVVYLCQRPGADGFTLQVALKFFCPSPYKSLDKYDAAMMRIGNVAAKVAKIQHENLIVVQNMVDRNRIRIMVMEYVEGFDLRQLLGSDTLLKTRNRLTSDTRQYMDRVLFTQGKTQPRFKAGVAVAIIRDCLAALAALHRANIVHGDIKPGNIMLRQSGRAKIIDIGSAFSLDHPSDQLNCSPEYAAPEVLKGSENTALSDLASLGYVLVELMAGQRLFTHCHNISELVKAKEDFPNRLQALLPEEIVRNNLLMAFINQMIAPKPENRFHTAEAADLVEHGAAAFHRQLIKSDLASEYDNDIRIMIQEILQHQGHQ